jgi:hypothetical protein
VDIGGTFTDIVLGMPDGTLRVSKVSSTPHDPGVAVVAGLAELLRASGVSATSVGEIVHGTTVASNTILQKTGAGSALHAGFGTCSRSAGAHPTSSISRRRSPWSRTPARVSGSGDSESCLLDRDGLRRRGRSSPRWTWPLLINSYEPGARAGGALLARATRRQKRTVWRPRSRVRADHDGGERHLLPVCGCLAGLALDSGHRDERRCWW